MEPAAGRTGYKEITDQQVNGKYDIIERPQSKGTRLWWRRPSEAASSGRGHAAHMSASVTLDHATSNAFFSAKLVDRNEHDIIPYTPLQVSLNDASMPFCTTSSIEPGTCETPSTTAFHKGDILKFSFDLDVTDAPPVFDIGRLVYTIVPSGKAVP